MKFRVGDRVKYIVETSYSGIEGTVTKIKGDLIHVRYDCPNTIKFWDKALDDIETENNLRKLTKLEKILK